jgi:hypothetical protein
MSGWRRAGYGRAASPGQAALLWRTHSATGITGEDAHHRLACRPSPIRVACFTDGMCRTVGDCCGAIPARIASELTGKTKMKSLGAQARGRTLA